MAASRRIAWIVAGIIAGAGLFAGLLASPGQAAVTTGGGCAAVARIDAQWGSGPTGGQIINVVVTNNAAAASTGWSVTWTPASGQTVRSSWNAVVSTAFGVLTATNASYNGTLTPGATASFGLQLAGVGPVPTLACDNGTATSADYSVAEADNGGTVNVRIGQTLAVSLPASYALPALSGGVLTLLSSTGGSPTGQRLTALYRASAAGAVDLTSGGWAVHVVVAGVGGTGSGQTITVTVADDQRTISAHTGDVVVVNLAADYVPPTATPSAVIGLASISGGYPTTEPLHAVYLLLGTGQAIITSYTDTACNHDPMPCPSPSVPWTLHVTVS